MIPITNTSYRTNGKDTFNKLSTVYLTPYGLNKTFFFKNLPYPRADTTLILTGEVGKTECHI